MKYEAPTFAKQATLQSITATNNNIISPFFNDTPVETGPTEVIIINTPTVVPSFPHHDYPTPTGTPG